MTGVLEEVDAADRYIGGKLLAARRRQGLGLNVVAEAVSVDPAELAAIEAGEGKVYVATLWRLSRALATDLDELLPAFVQ